MDEARQKGRSRGFYYAVGASLLTLSTVVPTVIHVFNRESDWSIDFATLLFASLIGASGGFVLDRVVRLLHRYDGT